MFDNWEFLIIAWQLTALLKRLLAIVQSRSSFALMRVSARPAVNFRFATLMVIVVLSCSLLFASPGTSILVRGSGLVLGVLLALLECVPWLEFREYGLLLGSRYIAWHSISKHEWGKPAGRFLPLVLRGSSALADSILVPLERQHAIDQLISGAARFEPSPTKLRLLRTFYRTVFYLGCVVVTWYLLQLLPTSAI